MPRDDADSLAAKKHRSADSTPSPVAVEFRAYDRTFWFAYLANGLTTMANAMLVRYSDFVNVLGGEEQQLGLIVGCGMIGSIAIRLWQGEAIDRYGSSRVWQWCQVLYTLSLLLHLSLSTAYGPGIFLVRTLLQASVAGVFGSSITFVSLRVPPQRMAEIIGTLGTSGFLGMMAGPMLSDWLGSGGVSEKTMVDRMFFISGALSAVSVVMTWLATNDTLPPRCRRRPSLWKVIARYHPWLISLTAGAMGAGFSIPMTFLRPFAIEANLHQVGLFFLVYAFSAFVARIASRSLFEHFGNRPMILTGLVLLSISFMCYVPVSQTWQLMIPGVLAGVAHALLFPSIMAEGTSYFPRRYLGVATSLVLASFDVGTFIGAPIVGVFLQQAKRHTTAAYPWMFAGIAAMMILVTVVFVTSRKSVVRKNL